MKVRRFGVALAALAALAIVVACSSTKPKSNGTPTPSPSVTTASATSSPPTVATQSSSDPAAEETTNRAAVQAAWIRFWKVNTSLMVTAAAQLESTVASVAVGPARKQMIATVTVYKSKHLTQYGFVVNHPYWQTPVAGKNSAVMGDCLDGSHFGTKSTITGQKRTVGPARDNTKASFLRGPDGVWRVQSIVYLLDVKC